MWRSSFQGFQGVIFEDNESSRLMFRPVPWMHDPPDSAAWVQVTTGGTMMVTTAEQRTLDFPTHRQQAGRHTEIMRSDVNARWHELERVTAAWERANALGDYSTAARLLAHRDTLVGQMAPDISTGSSDQAKAMPVKRP